MYIVYAKGSNGCIGAKQVTVPDAAPPGGTIFFGWTNVSCPGGSDGTATFGTVWTPNICEGPYTYKWSTGDTTASISGLSAGFYILTVTSVHGCSVAVYDAVVYD